MVAALDPLGTPLVSHVVAGDKADDTLYIPAVDRVLQIIDGLGLLFVGDSKMSALAIRAHIHHLQQHYLCPLAQRGDTATEMKQWIETANNGDKTLQPVYIEDEKGACKLLAEDYITARYQILAVVRQEETIAAHQKTLGWRTYVSDVPAEQLTLEQAVLTYRDEWIIERGFHCLKGVPLSLAPPLCQKR